MEANILLLNEYDTFCSFLKPESQETFFSNAAKLSINDFVPEKIKEYEAYLRERIKRNLESKAITESNESFSRTMPSVCKVETLKPAKRKEYDEAIQKFADFVFEKRVEAFHKGTPLMKLNQIWPPPPLFLAYLDDFDIPETELESLKKTLTLSKIIESCEATAKEVKLGERKRLIHLRSLQKNIKSLLELLDSLDLAHSHYFQLKFCLYSSKKLNLPIECLREEDMDFEGSLFDEIMEYKRKTAQKIGDELIAEEKKQNAKSKSYKSRNVKTKSRPKENKEKIRESKQIEATPNVFLAFTLNPLNTLIQNLNSKRIKSMYQLHARIKRWVCDLTAIRKFQDYNFDTKMMESRYATCSDRDLLKFKNRHNLAGIELFLSEPQIRGKYTFLYDYTDKKTQMVKKGIGIFAIMRVGDISESGIVHVGINDENVIFHALFDPIKDKRLLPQHIIKDMENSDGNPNVVEESFTLATSCIFSIKEENIIEMEIGKKAEDRVTFLFYPL